MMYNAEITLEFSFFEKLIATPIIAMHDASIFSIILIYFYIFSLILFWKSFSFSSLASNSVLFISLFFFDLNRDFAVIRRNNLSKDIPIEIQNIDNTHHQDQSMQCVNFNIIKAIVRSPQKPIPLLFELLFVLIFLYSYLYTVRFLMVIL